MVKDRIAWSTVAALGFFLIATACGVKAGLTAEQMGILAAVAMGAVSQFHKLILPKEKDK